MWAGIVEGLRFVWNNKVLRTLAFVDLAATGLYMPMESVLFPKYFTDRNEPAQLGWVLMALSIGGLIGALGYAVLSKYMSRRTTMLTAVLTLGVAMTVIAFLPPLPLILVLCVVVGLVYGPIAPIYNYVMQTRAPAASARPGGRGDGLAGLRRRSARVDRWRARWPTRPGCIRPSWRCRCRCCSSASSRSSCRRCANSIAPRPYRQADSYRAAAGPARAIDASSSRELAPTRWQARYTCPSTLRTDITNWSAI